jgi:hypothetical protein
MLKVHSDFRGLEDTPHSLRATGSRRRRAGRYRAVAGAAVAKLLPHSAGGLSLTGFDTRGAADLPPFRVLCPLPPLARSSPIARSSPT